MSLNIKITKWDTMQLRMSLNIKKHPNVSQEVI